MAHAYIPGLKVVEQTIVEKTRRLPLKGVVNVAVGQPVKADDVVAETNLPGNIFPLNVANLMNVEPADLPELMLKKIGQKIVKNELIAETKGLFGFFKQKANSPIDGTIESVSTVTGQVIFREAPIPVQVHAYVDGIVSEIIPDEGVVIRTNASYIQGIFGIGGETRGEIKVLTPDADTILDEKLIDSSCKGKIIVGGSFLTLAGFKKAIQMEAKGIVVGGFNYKDIKDIVGYDIGVAITGQEDVATTLIVTEGFGEVHMAHQTFKLLKSLEGQIASINGATQIRAGVIRPEVIIPRAKQDLEQVIVKEIAGLDVGTSVRVIRAPYFGLLGQVTDLPYALQKLESGSMARVAKVKIEEIEREVLLPRANLEMIETR
ncbi:MAG TPA: hypothetical protein ENN84_01165 [Candidatus Marinimicrobia bacterium]|nr:hypothetical protein [Candidatus Neomarinimicrobiota bacterium]